MAGDRLPYYAALTLKEEGAVRAVRDGLFEDIGAAGLGYEKVEPHVTVHPGFSCGHRAAARVAGVLAYVVGDELSVAGLEYWPGASEPVVAKLDLDADLSVYRQTIESHVKDSGGTVDREPVPPHVTLFKLGDADERSGVDAAAVAAALDGHEGFVGDFAGRSFGVSGYRVERRV